VRWWIWLGLTSSAVIGIAPKVWSQPVPLQLEHLNRDRASSTWATDNIVPSEREDQNETKEADSAQLQLLPEESSAQFIVFPVGAIANDRTVIFSLLVRGYEDGTQAIDFANWLVPFDAVIEALNLDITSLPGSQLELRSSFAIVRVDPNRLRSDPELGLVFSIAEIETLFGVTVDFDLNEYALRFDLPQLRGTGQFGSDVPLQLEGLPRIQPPQATLPAIEQRVNTAGIPGISPNFQGEFQAVATVFGGSAYLRTRQQDIDDSSTWTLLDAQYLKQTPTADYALGSQRPFWRSSRNDYWGITTIQRQGFTPPTQFGSGGFNANQRLQADRVGRTISGEADPGTLVRLTVGFGDRILDETLVDSSGVYRFEDIPVRPGSLSANYRVLLYPEGRLTAIPEIQEASFSTVPGQIPAGTSATIVSIGSGRDMTNRRNFFGEFTDVRGGIGQRWGISEEITLGVGTVYDETLRGLGELFFFNPDFPLEVAATVLTPDEEQTWDVDANVLFRPFSGVSLRFSSDRFSRRVNLDWRLLNGLRLLGTYNDRDGVAGGIQFFSSGRGRFTFVRATLDDNNFLRWNLRQQLGALEFSQQGNEISTNSELEYNLSGYDPLDIGHSLVANYETFNLNNLQDDLFSLGWRFRSQQQAADGRFQWETQLGYGMGSRGSGLLATVQTTLVPGLLLRARYEGVSVNAEGERYSLELVSSYNFQSGIFPGDRRSDFFRTQGGLMIRPFFDRNSNGKRDSGESYYTEDSNLLFLLNNRSLRSFRFEAQSDRILVRLPPGTYRLDLDPAGFPLDWQAPTDTYAVEVVPGSYTPVSINLIPSYTLVGVVTDAEGEPIAGARVDAIAADSDQRRFSVTNGAGVYYLERLTQGTFTLDINSKPATPAQIVIDLDSESFQELNLRLGATGKE